MNVDLLCKMTSQKKTSYRLTRLNVNQELCRRYFTSNSYIVLKK